MRGRRGGEERVTFVTQQGEARSVPVNWTDMAMPEPYAVVGRGRVRVRVEDLLLVVDLIDAGRGTSDEPGTVNGISSQVSSGIRP
jgi:hypothetical protein